MMDLAGVVRAYQSQYAGHRKLNAYQRQLLEDITRCRTPQLGGHIMACDECGCIRATYNSCGNRCCPQCGSYKRDKWILARKQEALPVTYFHVVFTVPHEYNCLFLQAPKVLYNLLFNCAWQTLREFGLDHKYLGAQMGAIGVLHSWGQNLSLHPHVHWLVPGGGITPQQKWRNMKKSKGKFLFPVKALSKTFKAKFAGGIAKLYQQRIVRPPAEVKSFYKWNDWVYRKKWVVFAKDPVPRGADVVEYLGRYTHKVAISNSRIKAIENGKVRFSWLDYRTSKVQDMHLPLPEFIHRFLLHMLPKGFIKVRYFGILANCHKATSIKTIFSQFGQPVPKKLAAKPWHEIYEILYNASPFTCRVCEKGRMHLIEVFPSPRAPPAGISNFGACSA
jgi:hypothetical protein